MKLITLLTTAAFTASVVTAPPRVNQNLYNVQPETINSNLHSHSKREGLPTHEKFINASEMEEILMAIISTCTSIRGTADAPTWCNPDFMPGLQIGDISGPVETENGLVYDISHETVLSKELD